MDRSEQMPWETREQAQEPCYITPSTKTPLTERNPNAPNIPWREIIDDLIRVGLSVSAIARHAGYSPETLYQRRRSRDWSRNPSFLPAVRLLGLHRALVGRPDHWKKLTRYANSPFFDP